jgi:antitoxin (DNA-binding transcriptional repressor) of toxin-antitoxin stability system
MGSMSVSEFRSQLRRAFARVESGEVLEITRDGQVAAVLIHPDLLNRRVRTPSVLAAEQLHDVLERARSRSSGSKARGLSNARAEELVKTIRGERDRRA